MIAQLRSELIKQRTTRTNAIVLLWMLGLIVLIVGLHGFGLDAETLRKAANQPNVFGWGTSIGALFAALVGALSITGEMRSGMIRPTLLANPDRRAVVAAKAMAAALAGLVVGLVSEVLVAALGSAALAVRGIDIAYGTGDFIQMLAGGAAAAAVWAAIGTGIGAVIRNQVGAVVGLCVWLILIESLLIGDVPSVAKFSPGASAGAVSGVIQNVAADTLIAPALGALLLIAYAAVAAGAGLLAIERRDID